MAEEYRKLVRKEIELAKARETLGEIVNWDRSPGNTYSKEAALHIVDFEHNNQPLDTNFLQNRRADALESFSKKVGISEDKIEDYFYARKAAKLLVQSVV